MNKLKAGQRRKAVMNITIDADLADKIRAKALKDEKSCSKLINDLLAKML